MKKNILFLALLSILSCSTDDNVSIDDLSADLSAEPIPMQAGVWLNAIGGVFLASAHIRNFRLCRKSSCCHGHD